jgi:hypothetical protein
MGMKNTPNPLATIIPGLSDPMQIASQQAGTVAREHAAASSLAQFNDSQARRRGRPARNPEAHELPDYTAVASEG